jgi:hypothetical protein
MHTGHWWAKRKGKRPLARQRSRLVDSIKVDIPEVGWSVSLRACTTGELL